MDVATAFIVTIMWAKRYPRLHLYPMNLFIGTRRKPVSVSTN